jgi:hypothetical protein
MFELNLDFSTTLLLEGRALTGLGLTEWSAVGEFETEKYSMLAMVQNFNIINNLPGSLLK